MGTFTGARKFVLETFAKTESAQMKKRVARYMVSTECPVCHGKRLKPEALKVKFEGLDITEMSRVKFVMKGGKVIRNDLTVAAQTGTR